MASKLSTSVLTQPGSPPRSHRQPSHLWNNKLAETSRNRCQENHISTYLQVLLHWPYDAVEIPTPQTRPHICTASFYPHANNTFESLRNLHCTAGHPSTQTRCKSDIHRLSSFSTTVTHQGKDWPRLHCGVASPNLVCRIMQRTLLQAKYLISLVGLVPFAHQHFPFSSC